jgi:hypothetical protein
VKEVESKQVTAVKVPVLNLKSEKVKVKTSPAREEKIEGK